MQQRREAGLWNFMRATLVGGVLFLLPLLLLVVLINRGLAMARAFIRQLLDLLPGPMIDGELAQLLAGLLALALVAFLAGLVARTGPGQRLVQWVGDSVLSSLPAMNVARGLLSGIDDVAAQGIKVVGVPDGDGWALGLVFDDDGDPLVPVFLPGVPQWQSGSLRLCHRDRLTFTDLKFHQVLTLARSLGGGGEAELRQLAPQLLRR